MFGVFRNTYAFDLPNWSFILTWQFYLAFQYNSQIWNSSNTIKKRPKNILDDGIHSSIHQRNLYLASIFIIVIELIQIPSRLKNFLPGGSTLKWKIFYCKTDETIHRDQEKIWSIRYEVCMIHPPYDTKYSFHINVLYNNFAESDIQ